MITLENISKNIGDKTILSDLSFGIHALDKIGIVGINGSGKTTLLKLLTSQTEPTSGIITLRKGITYACLMQDVPFDPTLTVLEYVTPDKISQHDEYDEHKIKAVLTTLGVTEFDKPLRLLSGGQRRKTDLAKVLVQDPDIIILDEPTNHLDMDSIEWLQEYLANAKKTLIFVTHDRYFLDAVCNKILEIDNSECFIYEGTYTEYVKGKLIRATDAQRKETRRNAQLKKELDWLQRGAKARATKPKNHVDRVKELLSKSYLISNAELNISFQTDRLGKTILELHKISKSYGDRELFLDLEHHFQPRERIGVIGPNGCGKTTLLRLITGEEDPDMGTIKAGINTHFAYYRQEEDAFDPMLSVYDYIAQYAEVIRTKDGSKVSATEMLGRFLFDGKMQQMKLSALSGGERKRLFLLKSLMFGANFIILDEPTNDLDIRTLEILEDYLDAFDGCLLVVSHDRYFLDRCIDYLFVFEPAGIRKFAGNYSDYSLVHRYEKEEIAEKPVILKPKRIYSGLNYNEQREFNQLEADLSSIEQRIQELEENLADPSGALNHSAYLDISTELSDLQNRHDQMFDRWAELLEKQS